MVEFFIYWDRDGSIEARKPKIALLFNDQFHSLDSLTCAVPTYSVIGDSTKGQAFRMSGMANQIVVENGKAIIT